MTTKDVLLSILRHRGDCTIQISSCFLCPFDSATGRCLAIVLSNSLEDVEKKRYQLAKDKYHTTYGEDEDLFEALL